MPSTRVRIAAWLLALGCNCAAGAHDGTTTVTVGVEPKAAYIETRGTEQRVNFDLLLDNPTPHPLRIGKIEVSAYDRHGALAFRRYLDENGRPCGICTLPERLVPANGRLDLFNPFHSWPGNMPLATLHYELFFEPPETPQPNLLSFPVRMAIDVHPTLYEPKTYLRLPLRGRIYVFDGHDYYSHHRRQDVFRSGAYRPNAVRYGYDLMIIDPEGRLYRGDQFKKDNWLSYGAPVFAPANARVVESVNDVPDNSYDQGRVVYPASAEQIDPVGLGNHVTLDFGNGEFGMLLHLKPGSVTVRTGDRVVVGQQIGAIGFSGDSFLPHLHTMNLTGSDERTSQGLPSYYEGFWRVLGVAREHIGRGQIDSGDILEYRSAAHSFRNLADHEHQLAGVLLPEKIPLRPRDLR